MRKNRVRMWLLILAATFGLGFIMTTATKVSAEDVPADWARTVTEDGDEEQPDEIETTAETAQEEAKEKRTSLTISPASKTLSIEPNVVEEDYLNVTNDGEDEITVEVYAAPYSYVYSEEADEYRLGYSHENTFTQLSRWTKIRNKDGIYETKATFKIAPKETQRVKYKITMPEDVPSGGQYAVIFAQVRSDESTAGAIRADPSLGMIVYGRSTDGEIILGSEFRDMKLGEAVKSEYDAQGKETKKTIFYGSTKVKNTGNVDFFVRGVLKATPIIGFSSYETPADKGIVSVIPESELTVSDQWEDLPGFGIYRVTWTVEGGGDKQMVEQILFRFSPFSIIIMLLVLTIIIVGVIMLIKRRKATKSRLAI